MAERCRRNGILIVRKEKKKVYNGVLSIARYVLQEWNGENGNRRITAGGDNRQRLNSLGI